MYSAQPLEACPRAGSLAMVKEKEFFSGGHDELQLKIKLLVVAACLVRASLAGSTALTCRLCYRQLTFKPEHYMSAEEISAVSNTASEMLWEGSRWEQPGHSMAPPSQLGL